MSIRVVTWNINSVRLRISSVERLIKMFSPDVLCLQEIKCREAEFPSAALADLEYKYIALNAQKGYHGVVIISRLPLTNIKKRNFCEMGDARHVSADVASKLGGQSSITVHNFYVPAGGDIPDVKENPKFGHKLNFLREMADWFGADEVARNKAILVGDLNVAPLENDVWSHKALLSVVSHTPIEAQSLAYAMSCGPWLDAIRRLMPEPERVYTWWSYRSPNWLLANKGRRLDHVWISEALAESLKGVTIVQETRCWERPSDHVPVILDLE